MDSFDGQRDRHAARKRAKVSKTKEEITDRERERE